MNNFSVVKRNYGHWDFLGDKGRLFRVRGTPGDWWAMDERAVPYPVTKFKSFGLCVAFVMNELMHEDLVVEYLGSGNNKLAPAPLPYDPRFH